MMRRNEHSWQGKKIVVIGAARQGVALARYLASQGAHVLLNDQRPLDQLEEAQFALRETVAAGQVEWVAGGHPFSILEGAHLVCPSGGVPLTLPVVQEALRLGMRLSNDSQIFMEAVPCRVIGITGSAGKTTTTTLVGRIAQKAVEMRDEAGPGIDADHTWVPSRAWVGGNIGNPLIADLEQMQENDLVVMELSSFQLELMTVSPQVGAVLNITPNHLDRHANMQDYIDAKARLVENQMTCRATGWQRASVLGLEDAEAWKLRERARGSIWTFGHTLAEESYPGAFVREEYLVLWDGEEEHAVMPRSSVQLRGEHNLLNVLAACAISAAAGLPLAAMRAGVIGFTGVPHRLEYIRTWGGAAWYNDSMATAPERSMAGVRSFREPVVLLAGGRDKKLPWDAFACLVQERVDHLILFGEAATIIQKALADAGVEAQGETRPYTLSVCKNLREAVAAAAEVAAPGDVVLLSPGGTSFDEFRDFEERGEVFKKWVLELS